MITIFTLTSNASSRKAVAWLKGKEIPFTEQRMNTHPLTLNQLRDILKLTDSGTDQILATNSKIYGDLVEQGVDFNELTIFELHYIIRKYPRIVKGPILLARHKVSVGFNDDSIQTFLPRVERMAIYFEMLEKARAEEDKRINENGRHNRYAAPGGMNQ